MRIATAIGLVALAAGPPSTLWYCPAKAQSPNSLVQRGKVAQPVAPTPDLSHSEIDALRARLMGCWNPCGVIAAADFE
jgi:hypothetical protein